MAEMESGVETPIAKIRGEIRNGMPVGFFKLGEDISKVETLPAVRDVPGNKDPDPDLFPAKIYKWCPLLHKAITTLFTGMLEYDCIQEGCVDCIAPLDDAGIDPALRGSETPVAPPGPLVKLVE